MRNSKSNHNVYEHFFFLNFGSINADVDLIVSGVDLLTKLGQVPGKERNHNALRSVSDLQETFTYFFTRGCAAERIFADSQAYRDIVKAAFSLDKVEVSKRS